MSNKCILVAEDDAAIRRVLADSLAGAGYEVRTAPNGRAAFELLLSTPVDLALLDVNMPEISGFKLLRMMQKECPGIPSIILTACGDEQDRVKGLQLGADDYVVKPFSIAELLARIAAVLRRSPGRQLAVQCAIFVQIKVGIYLLYVFWSFIKNCSPSRITLIAFPTWR